jgi:hypothetical protein
MYYPDTWEAPNPNEDMPESVKEIYIEAASIANKSPRWAAALLRYWIQILCKELWESWKDINKDIWKLVEKWLPQMVQKSLDIVRVTWNDAVHPWQIDTDNSGIVKELFKLINIIIEYTISLPSKVDAIYEELPEEKKEGIKNRDK